MRSATLRRQTPSLSPSHSERSAASPMSADITSPNSYVMASYHHPHDRHGPYPPQSPCHESWRGQ